MSQIIASIIGSIGFSIVFGIRRAYMLPIWAVYLLVNGFAGDFAANMVSAMFCSLVAALMARRLRVPTVVLQMPATVPMVPGGSLYYTIYYVFAGDMPTAKSYFFFTARAVFGMAIGFAVVSVLFKTIDARKAAR